MKKTLVALLVASLCAVASLAQTAKPESKPAEKTAAKTGEKPAAKAEFKSEQEKLSYALGVDIGMRLKDLETDIDLAAFLKGVEDRLEDREPALSVEELNTVKKTFFDKKKEETEAKKKALTEANKAAGEKFLAENKAKPGVKVTASGLQYEVLQEGTGEVPKSTDKVKVHYRGTLLNGTEFDSSHKRGQPATFPVSGVIKGWTEGLQLMKVGSKYKFFIPSELAYGERGAGKDIGPFATLVFEVELISIEPAQPAPAAPAAPPAPKAQPTK